MGLFKKAVTTVASGIGISDPVMVRWSGGEPAHSGERVTVDTALQLDTVWACARIIASTIATLPVMLYERQRSGLPQVAIDHPLYRVIHDRPNLDMTAVEFWTAVIACKLLWGNGYAAITKRSDGSVIALDPMRTDRVTVDLQRDGSRTYTYVFNGVTTVYQEEDVLHLKGFSLDGQTGMSTIAAGRHSLGTAIGAERVAGSIFKHGMRPSGYFKIPQFLSAENRAKARAYIEKFTGSENTGKVPMVEGGWEFVPTTIPPNDAQFLETRGFNVETICRWFGVPPSLVGHTEKTTSWGTGLEQINLGFLTYTLRAHLKEIEQALSVKCLAPGDRDRFYPEFNVEGLLRADSAGRAAYYHSMVTDGLMTPNEVRKLENLPPLPGGDQLFMQGAMMPISLLVKQAEAAAQLQAQAPTARQIGNGEPGVARDAAAVATSERMQ
jgi:HK97 family phage portal protein